MIITAVYIWHAIVLDNIFLQKMWQQAGAELGQAQDKLKVKVDAGVEVQVKVGDEVEV